MYTYKVELNRFVVIEAACSVGEFLAEDHQFQYFFLTAFPCSNLLIVVV